MSEANKPAPGQKPRTDVRPGGAATNAPAGGTPTPQKVASPPPPAGAETPPPPGGQKPVVDDGTMPHKQTASGVSGTTGPFSQTVPEPTAGDEETGTGRDPGNFPGRDGGINEHGAMAARLQAGRGDDYDVSIPADPLAPKLTVRATSEGDAEKKYRDQAGIITTRHEIRAVRK